MLCSCQTTKQPCLLCQLNNTPCTHEWYSGSSSSSSSSNDYNYRRSNAKNNFEIQQVKYKQRLQEIEIDNIKRDAYNAQINRELGM